MPIKHAALKQIRKDRKRRERNQSLRSELHTITKRLQGLLSSRQLEEAGKLIHLVAKKYDHAASKHIIHRNAASRYKSRLMRRLNQLRAASK